MPSPPVTSWQQREKLKTAHAYLDLYEALEPAPKPVFDGNTLAQIYRERRNMWISPARHESMHALLELDPNHKLVSDESWEQVRGEYATGTPHLYENPAERLKFTAVDTLASDHFVHSVEQRALGSLAARLAKALDGHAPDPEHLAKVVDEMAVDHPYLANPWKVEMLIADMRRVYPSLGAWDFRQHTDGKAYRAPRKLPASTQAAITRIGYPALSDSAVLMTSHMYRDALVMADALEALGADPKAMRFVATPYPFDPRVKTALGLRGIVTTSAPYDQEATRRHVVTAVRAVLDSGKDGPILVLDDGGLATEVIAKDFPAELYRFRIVEVTKAGERIGKSVLPKQLEWTTSSPAGRLEPAQREALHTRYLEAHSWDPASKVEAEAAWQTTLKYASVGGEEYPSQRQPSADSSTNSNTAYKREVMTPLYTEQVNRSLFNAIERAGKKPANQRVTVIGGGAMGLAAARELRDSGHEVTFVEPERSRVAVLEQEGFAVEPLRSALKGRAIVLEMSGMKNVLGLNEVFQIDDGAFVVHGSSKDNPFDMKAFSAMATEKIAWPEHNGQRSATYRFNAAGRKKELHFLGDGFTISHGGKTQNVPLEQFTPELDALLNIGVHAVQQPPAVTYYPFFTATEGMMHPELAAK